MITKSTAKSTTKCLARRKAGMVKSWMTGATVLGALGLGFLACANGGKSTKEEAYHYKAPRNIGFTLEDWLKEHPEYRDHGRSLAELPRVKCTAYDLEKCPEYCDEEGYQRLWGAWGSGFLALRDDCPDLTPWAPYWDEILPPGSTPPDSPALEPMAPEPVPRFWGVLDIDYDYQETVYVNDTPAYTPVRILKILEAFDDRRPPLAPTEGTLPARVQGGCTSDGVCGYGHEHYGLLWSGVNLVYGYYWGGCCEKGEQPYLDIVEAFPIEKGRIYDWWGGYTDWEDYRKKIIAFIEAQKELYPEEYAGYAKYCERVLYCGTSDGSGEPSTDSGSSPDGVTIFDL